MKADPSKREKTVMVIRSRSSRDSRQAVLPRHRVFAYSTSSSSSKIVRETVSDNGNERCQSSPNRWASRGSSPSDTLDAGKERKVKENDRDRKRNT